MSSQALEVVPKGNLAITNEQLTLAQSTVAKDLTKDEFEIFLYNCQRQGIHPLDGLLVPIARTDNGQRKLTFVTTVDLLRSRAAETDEYAGNDDPMFEYGKGEDKDPTLATVTVWKMVQGQRCAFTATARYAEYYPGDKQGFMWRSKPHVMLGKCAEGLALRKAFPKQLAGLYLEEELQREDKPATPRKPASPPPAPVGDVKCSECKASGGHLPSCSKRQGQKAEAQPAVKSEAVMCGDCQKIGGHEPSCKYATKQEAPMTEGLKQAAVLILSVTKALKNADKNGKREPYVRVEVVNAANEQFTLYVWHKTPQEFLTPALVDKRMICEFKVGKKGDGSAYNTLENILELDNVPFFENKPAEREPGSDDEKF